MDQDWHWVERCAARFGLVPWHEYRRLPAIDRAEILAEYQEHCLREGIRSKRLEDRNNNKGSSMPLGVEDWL